MGSGLVMTVRQGDSISSTIGQVAEKLVDDIRGPREIAGDDESGVPRTGKPSDLPTQRMTEAGDSRSNVLLFRARSRTVTVKIVIYD